MKPYSDTFTFVSSLGRGGGVAPSTGEAVFEVLVRMRVPKFEVKGRRPVRTEDAQQTARPICTSIYQKAPALTKKRRDKVFRGIVSRRGPRRYWSACCATNLTSTSGRNAGCLSRVKTRPLLREVVIITPSG